jgi:DNA-binding NtrC family response regulator
MTELLRQFMTKRGFRVLTATGGEEALSVVAQEAGKIEMVITDMTMPGMDGVEVAEKLAESAPGVPVLIATGHDTGGPMEAMPSNVVAIVQKPYQNRALVDQIRAILDAKSP